MTWEILAGLGIGASVLLGLVAFAWWAMASLKGANADTREAKDGHDVERRLRRDAEKQRDDALATVAAHVKTIATLRAVNKVTAEQEADLAAAAAKKEQDAISSSAGAAADAAVDLMRG